MIAKVVPLLSGKPGGPVNVYVFRESLGGGRDTIVCAAPTKIVASVFGGGGIFRSDGLSAEFDGCACFRNTQTGEPYLAIWGVRKASRFRSLLRRNGHVLAISHKRPRIQLIVKLTRN